MAITSFAGLAFLMEGSSASKETYTNPKVIIEVLSPMTESFDQIEKSQGYQMFNSTLTDYLLVAQDRPFIEHFNRQSDGGWLLHRYLGTEATVLLPTIDCRLPLKEVYDRVEFEAK